MRQRYIHWMVLAGVLLGLSAGSDALRLQVEAKTLGSLQVSVDSIPKSRAKAVQGRVVVDAPPQVVWKVLTDYPEWKNRVPGYEQSRVLKSTAMGKIVDVAMKVGALLPACRYQVRAQEKETNYRLVFERISGDFDAMKAVYQLTPQSNGKQTILDYELNIDVGMPLPGINGILKSNTEKSLSALKRYSELEASQRTIGQR
ncbi:MAG TPA: SRPBCC family protein [Oculatellaceae cyanobacterium]|jgi:ribosome-associated toxin RatA of RatAB toxin-antitoxin module